MDEADRAQRTIEQDLERAIAAARGIPSTQGNRTTDGECVECRAEIPEPRRLALPGCCLCLDCAAELERANQMRARR